MFNNRRRRRPCPATESLETRALLSTITVTSLEDNETVDGEVTLREAVLAANSDISVDGSVAGQGADIIKFAPGLNGGTITLSNGELGITKTLTIDGPRGRITIDANKESRIFNIDDVSRVRLQDLKLINGRDTFGGAVHSEARVLWLVRSRFVNNRATFDGGAIYSSGADDGHLGVRSTWFRDNRSKQLGGAVNVAHRPNMTTLIQNSIFRENIGTGVVVRQGPGADVQPFHGASDEAVISDSQFIGNGSGPMSVTVSAESVSDTRFYDNRGRGVLSGVRLLSDSDFHNNNATVFVVEAEAVNDDADTSTVEYATIRDTSFTDSETRAVVRANGICADDETAASVLHVERSHLVGNPEPFGDGILAFPCGAVEVEDSRIAGMFDNGVTADFVTLVRSSVTDNGGIGVSGQANISSSTIAHNDRGGVSTLGTSVIRNSTISSNGDIGVRGAADGDLTLSGSTVFGNVLTFRVPAVSHASVVENSIIAHNMTPAGDRWDLILQEDGTVSHSLIATNRGTDLEEAQPGSPDANGNFVGSLDQPVDPHLAALGDNGGGFMTHAISPNSPALNAADPASSSSADQTGRDRTADTGPDMGAFEFDAALRHAPDLTLATASVRENLGDMFLHVGLTEVPLPGETVTVTLTTRGAGSNPANPDLDYVLETDTITFDSTSPPVQLVRIDLVDDEIAEPAQRFRIDASVSGNVREVQDRVIGEIWSDDVAVIRVTGAQTRVEDEGEFLIKLKLEGAVDVPFKVSAETRNREADKNDYEEVLQELAFTGDQNEVVEVRVPIIDDAKIEFDEDLRLLLGNPKWFIRIQQPKINLTIQNDDTGTVLRDRILHITGTAHDDLLDITESAGVVTANLNGTEHDFDRADVRAVRINTLSGDDKITLNTTLGSQVLAGAGDDTVLGGGGYDNIFGGPGRDVLNGRGGIDKVRGQEDGDLVVGGEGRDSVFGGGGQDTVFGGGASDSLDGGAGNDWLVGGSGRDTMLGGIGNDTSNGGTGNDSIVDSKGRDQLFGEAGDDSLYGGDGNDQLHGGSGDDLLSGSSGNDLLLGDDGEDRLFGGDGKDTLEGGNHEDFLLAGWGDDSLSGGSGRDILFAGLGADTLNGNVGEDLLNASLYSHIGAGEGDLISNLRVAWESSASYADRIIATTAVLNASPRVSSRWQSADSSVDVFASDPSLDWLQADSELDTFSLEAGETLAELI